MFVSGLIRKIGNSPAMVYIDSLRQGAASACCWEDTMAKPTPKEYATIKKCIPTFWHSFWSSTGSCHVQFHSLWFYILCRRPEIYRTVLSPSNCKVLLEDLNVLLDWCDKNGMSPEHLGQVRNHECCWMLTVTVKAFALLGFIRRKTAVFINGYALKSLFLCFSLKNVGICGSSFGRHTIGNR